MLQRGLDCGHKHHRDDAQWRIKACEMSAPIRYLVVRCVTPALQLQRVPALKVNGTRCCEAAWGRTERAGLTGICSPDSCRLLMEGSCCSLVSKVTSRMATRSFDVGVSVNACTALLLVKMCPSAGPRGSTGGGGHPFSLTCPPQSSCKSQMEHKDKGSHGDPQSLILLLSCKQTKKKTKFLRLTRCYRCFPSVH